MHSSDPLFPWFFGAAILIAAVIILIGFLQQKKRTAALTALAPTLGFNFQGDDSSDASCGPLQTALFSRGSSRKFRNVMTGTFAGDRVGIFDYSYTTGSGKSSTTWTQTVVAFSLEIWLPFFELHPESFLDRVADVVIHKDVDFTSHPEFSRRYLLRGNEQEKICELFSPALLTFLEGLDSATKWHIEGDGYVLIFYCSDTLVAPEEILPLLEKTSSIAKNFIACSGLQKQA